MKKLEVITRPEKLEDVKEVMNNAGFHGISVTMVSGCGQQKGIKEFYRGTEYEINLLPKVKIELIIPDESVNRLVNDISDKIHTGEIGDGKIFVYNVEEVVKIRTGERGENAI
jgi:nitrogen regulatory protein PII